MNIYIYTKENGVVVEVHENPSKIHDDGFNAGDYTYTGFSNPDSNTAFIVTDVELEIGKPLPADIQDKRNSSGISLEQQVKELKAALTVSQSENAATQLALAALFELVLPPVDTSPVEAPDNEPTQSGEEV
ncbi:hypothetical protein D1872_73190 [compost metagenome]